MESAQHPGPYLRSPHLHQDLIAFTAADDVWLADASGGRAWRLTREGAPVTSPRISPDGTQVAYVSTREGHAEVYAANIDSGEVRRLTYWGSARTLLLGWAPDGRLLAATNAGEVHRHQVIRALDLTGRWERLQLGSASGAAFSDSGAVALTTPWLGRPPAHWKRYRGGSVPTLWLDPSGTGDWIRPLPEETAGIVDPMFLSTAAGTSLVFVSDRAARFPDAADEQANLWIWDDWEHAAAAHTSGDSADAHPAPPRQLTFQTPQEGYVRDATTDGERITWHSRGEIWILDSPEATPRRLELTLPGTGVVPRSIRPTENLDAILPDHGADSSVVSWRGTTYWMTHREGPARAVSAEAGVRTRLPVHLGRTGKVALITDAEGEDSLEIRSVHGEEPPRRLLTGQLGRVLHLASDPEGTRLAVISHDGAVRMVHLGADSDSHGGHAQPRVDDLAHCRRGEPQTPSFSPDGRYLVWSQPTEWGQKVMHQIMLADTERGSTVELTSGRFHDFSPAFTEDGQYLVLLSSRTFDPAYDEHSFDLYFTGSVRPWLIPLAASQPPPFGPSAEGWPLSGEAAEAAAGKAAAGDEHSGQSTTPASDADSAPGEQPPRSPDVDPETEQRLVPFPVASDAYRDLRAARGGVLWVKESRDEGELGSRRAQASGEKTPDQLIRWDFESRKSLTLAQKVTSYAVCGSGERVVVRHEDSVTVVPAVRTVEEDDAERVTVDLSRLRLQVDPAAEWRQMFAETHRLMAQQYWREDMDGVDWDAVGRRWRPVVEKVRCHSDLTDLLWEMVGELNTSHAYVLPQGEAPGAERALGLLGADLSSCDHGWRIDRILPGDSSDPKARSPLLAAGVGAREGDVITAVDGHPVDPVSGPAKHLVGAAEKPVELTLRREGAERRVVVVPVADEAPLRYQDWVRSRRDYVAAASGGRLGYVHVPDMQSTGWAQLHRDLHKASRAEGIIADMRFNGGGHTSQLVIEKLAQRVVAWNTVRHQPQALPYPESARRGPVVLVANEYSGSDGDIVNAVAQTLDIGPVVGVRTWGGVIGIDGRFDLVDGTRVTQPKYSYWIGRYGWGVENHGVDPDIEVIHDPGQLFAEEDPQLDRAVAEALRGLERTPAAAAPDLPAPRVADSAG